MKVSRQGSVRPGLSLVLRRELRWMRRRLAIPIMTLGFPLLVFAVLAAVFNTGLPTHLPVAVLDQDRTTLSRQIIQMIDASSDVAVAERVDDLAGGRRLMLEGRVYAVVMIPANLERDVTTGRRPTTVVFYNNEFLTIGSLVSRALGDALGTAEAGIAMAARLKQGESPPIALLEITPIPVQINPLFNPTMNYIYFLLVALIPTVLQIFICVTSAYSVSLERRSTLGLVILSHLGGGLAPAIIGKLLPYTLAFLITLGVSDAVLFGALGTPFRGDWRLLLLADVLFILAYQMIGALFALIGRDTVQALGFAGILTAPSFGFIGVSFPSMAMGSFPQVWGDLLPAGWYMQIRIEQTLKGLAPVYSLGHLAALATLLAVVTLLTVLRLLSLRRARLATPEQAQEVVT
jgi:ABC-2 type transport system permease protein